MKGRIKLQRLFEYDVTYHQCYVILYFVLKYHYILKTALTFLTSNKGQNVK